MHPRRIPIRPGLRLIRSRLSTGNLPGMPSGLDREFGILDGEAPAVLDNLTLIQGVDHVVESALHRSGVFRFKQIGAWSDANVAAIAHRLGVEKSQIERQKWVPQAATPQRVIHAASPVWAEDRPSLEAYRSRASEVFAGEPVHLSEDLGILYAKRPDRIDSLVKIHGIDAGIEKRLNASGVYRFRQIANWSARNVHAFAEWFGCHPDRIYRDRWIAQALEFDQRGPLVDPVPQPVGEASGWTLLPFFGSTFPRSRTFEWIGAPGGLWRAARGCRRSHL